MLLDGKVIESSGSNQMMRVCVYVQHEINATELEQGMLVLDARSNRMTPHFGTWVSVNKRTKIQYMSLTFLKS